MIDIDQERRLEAFLPSLSDVAWFANPGHPSPKYHVAADAVVAWDDWNAAMLAVWLPRSERLDALAVRAIGDPAIESIFHRVDGAIEPSVHAAVRAYFARRPDTPKTPSAAPIMHCGRRSSVSWFATCRGRRSRRHSHSPDSSSRPCQSTGRDAGHAPGRGGTLRGVSSCSSRAS